MGVYQKFLSSTFKLPPCVHLEASCSLLYRLCIAQLIPSKAALYSSFGTSSLVRHALFLQVKYTFKITLAIVFCNINYD